MTVRINYARRNPVVKCASHGRLERGMQWPPRAVIEGDRRRHPPAIMTPHETSSHKGSAPSADAFDVLAGGGEMGALMRSIDWAKTPAGPIETWPQSLRTVLGILLASDHPIFVWWGSDLVQFYNDGYRPILGSTKHPAAMGQRGRDCWQEIWDVIAPMIDKVFVGGSTYIKDGLLVLDRNGFLEECYFDYAYSPIRGESGDVAGVFVACSETSGRVIGERRLKTLGCLGAKASEAKSPEGACRATAAVLAEAKSDVPFALLYLLDEGGSTARLVETLGIEAGHPLVAPAEVSLRDGDLETIWCLRRAREGDIEVDLTTLTERLPGGPWPEAATRAHVLPLEGGSERTPYGLLVAGVSPRIPYDDAYRGFLRLVAGHVASAVQNGHAYAEEKSRAEALAALDRAKTTFFSNVSHEFRTPLTLMLGPIEDGLLDTENPLPPEQRRRLEMIHRNGLRLQKLVNSLLDFSRLGAGGMSTKLETVDLAALTAGVASAFDSLVNSASLRFVVDCPALPESVSVDRNMWEKVVLNLISNAFKFTLAGEIGVRLRWKGERVELAVSDTGIGIAPTDQACIFERFHRVEGAAGRSDEGSGIGLSLVREFVRLHGGEVTVESTEGLGSTFTVSLPIGAAPPSTPPLGTETHAVSGSPQATAFVHEAEQWHAGPPTSASDGEDPDLDVQALDAIEREEPRGHVLLADDNADMRDYIGRLLASRFTVESVADGQAALEAVRARLPDVVLSDVMMPRLDGIALVRAMKADPRTAHVPIMLISARAGEEATVEGLGAGVADYVVKPFGARELLARVEASVKSARSQAEKARLLEEVAEERARLKGVVENAPAFVCALDGPDHVFQVANAPYQRLVGLGRPLVGLPVREALPEVVEQGFVALLDEVLRTGEPFHGSEIRVGLDRSGVGQLDEAFVNFVYQPRRSRQGKVVGVDVFGFEVTDQVKARRQAEVLSQQLRLADQRKNEFLAMLAHELRNPMAAISLALTLLDQGEREPAKAARYRDTAKRQMNHLERLVDDLLDVSWITRGQVDLRKETTDLAAIVESAVAASRAAVAGRRHDLTITNSSPGSPLEMHADPTRLEQVVVNLLTNAAKYTEPGGRIFVHLSTETTKGLTYAVLSVSDTGRGIPKEMLANVFDMFVQVTPSIDRSTGGLGLGLTLVKGLVEMHDGDVQARSDGPGTGSEFVVRLPLTARLGARSEKEERTPKDARGVEKRRILLVEDAEDLREMFKEFLETLGHEVSVAVNGVEGLASALELRHDVLLVDVGLPGLDGYELARRVRAAPGGDKLFLVALTGYGGEEAKALAVSAGFDLHLTKPVDVNLLPGVLARSLRDA